MSNQSLEYKQFLESKRLVAKPVGFSIDSHAVNSRLFAFQRDIVIWAIKMGRAGIFADCGLGKTPIQLEWAKFVCNKTRGNVLILAPLAVSQQTKREGVKFSVPVNVCKTASDITSGVNITNYERIHYFLDTKWEGIVLDESSILKGTEGKTRKLITDFAKKIPYRLACSATPAPNDYMELGTHAEFFDIMTVQEMLSMFFVHDGGDTSKWRLKRHAKTDFWKWLASWSVAIRKPSDIGYEDGGFKLPPLKMHSVCVAASKHTKGFLFAVEAKTLIERSAARKDTIGERVKAAADLINNSTEPWLVWCNLNSESNALKKAITDSVEVSGADSSDFKEQAVLDFVAGKTRVLISKPTIFGFGINLQHCSNVAFVGLSDSYEQFYQAIRRCWRFGQTREVNCYLITAETEGAVVRNIQRKEEQATELMTEVVRHMREEMKRNLKPDEVSDMKPSVTLERVKEDRWEAIKGDCVEALKGIKSNSIHYSIFSPPFASLYTYSNSERDMGNVKNYEEFEEHFSFLLPELHRVLMPGRLLSFHCMNLSLTKERDEVIGVRDFRGELIRMFQKVGFIFHSEVCIWKDPVTAMQRTKSIGLLYKQLRKDSCMSRQGIPDYLVTMRKRGENIERVTKTHESFPVKLWQNYASPVWMDINQSGTLQRKSVREHEDERHICPLQLEVIERAVRLWTNPDDVVLDPFAGIGSSGYVALQQGRRALMCELKGSYFKQLVANLKVAEKKSGTKNLFGESKTGT